MEKLAKVHYAPGQARGSVFGYRLEPGDAVQEGDQFCPDRSGVWYSTRSPGRVLGEGGTHPESTYVRPCRARDNQDLTREATESRHAKIENLVTGAVRTNPGTAGAVTSDVLRDNAKLSLQESEVRAAITRMLASGELVLDPDDILDLPWTVHEGTLDKPHQYLSPHDGTSYVVMLKEVNEVHPRPVRTFLDQEEAQGWAEKQAERAKLRELGEGIWEGRVGEYLEIIALPLGTPEE